MKLARCLLSRLLPGRRAARAAALATERSAERSAVRSAVRSGGGQTAGLRGAAGPSSTARLFGGRYAPIAELGAGSQGTVHLARDVESGRLVVVKIARHDVASREALDREIEALRALRDTGVVPRLLGILAHRGRRVGFAVAHHDAMTLDRVLARGDFRSPREIRALARRLTRAVLTMLRRDWLHRDLKPENVLVDRHGRVWIIDFGLACPRSEARHLEEVSGTLSYSAPEQLSAHRVTAKSDLFSLGAILYELATGRPLFPDVRELGFPAYLAARESCLASELDLGDVDETLADLIRRLLVSDRAGRADVVEVEARLTRITANTLSP